MSNQEKMKIILTFGDNLRDIMREDGVTSEELENRTGITARTIRRYLRGDIEIGLTNLVAIAKALDVDYSDLIGII